MFFIGIDKGNTNDDVILFDSIAGIEYPSASGTEGNGNAVHLLYNIQGTPSIVVITTDKLIAVHQIYPPEFNSVVDSVSNAGGIQQSCTTDIPFSEEKELFTIGPNPVNDIALIILNLESECRLGVQVFNLTGQPVIQYPSINYSAGKHTFEADLTGFQEGFYFVRLLKNESVLYTKKIILLR